MYKLNWRESEAIVAAMAHKLPHISADPNGGEKGFKGIVAITRGGLYPAMMLSQLLDIRVIETLAMKSYDANMMPGAVEILATPTQAMGVKGSRWLIVDDIIDTGNTFAAARRLLPDGIYLAMVSKMPPNNLEYAQHYMTKEHWVEFPWEIKS